MEIIEKTIYIYNAHKRRDDTFVIHRNKVKEEIFKGVEGYRIILHDERKFGAFIRKDDIETHKEFGTTHLFYGYTLKELTTYIENNWIN